LRPATDGAAALVLTNETFAKHYGSPAVHCCLGAINGPRASPTTMKSPPRRHTARKRHRHEIAGVGPEDTDVAELHDCFPRGIVDSEDLSFFASEGGPAVAGAPSALTAKFDQSQWRCRPRDTTEAPAAVGRFHIVVMQLRGRHPNQCEPAVHPTMAAVQLRL
jgi:hypothetical protein